MLLSIKSKKKLILKKNNYNLNFFTCISIKSLNCEKNYHAIIR